MLIWAEEIPNTETSQADAELALQLAIAQRCALEKMAAYTLRRLFEAIKSEVAEENSRCSRQLRLKGGDEFISVSWEDNNDSILYLDLWPEGEIQFSVTHFGSAKQFGSLKANPLHTNSVLFPFADGKRIPMPTEEVAHRLLSSAIYGRPLHERRASQR